MTRKKEVFTADAGGDQQLYGIQAILFRQSE